MKINYFGFAALLFFTMSCNSNTGGDHDVNTSSDQQEQLADSLAKTDQERADSFMRANGIK